MLVALLAAALPFVAPPQAPDPISPPPPALVEALHLAPFYAKHLNVDGLPVLASAQVSDFALREAAYLIRQMVGQRPEILAAIAAQKVRFVVMAPTGCRVPHAGSRASARRRPGWRPAPGPRRG